MAELINWRGWGEEESENGCTRKNSKGRRKPSTTWCCHRGHPDTRQKSRAFAGLAWPVPMGPRGRGPVFRGFAWTRSGVLKPDLKSAYHDLTSIQNLAPWNPMWGTKRGKGLKVHMYWAKYFPEMPCLR